MRVDRLDLGLERVEVFALLGQAVELPLRAFGHRIQAVQPLLQRAERSLLSLQRLGRCGQLLNGRHHALDALGELCQLLFPCRHGLGACLGRGDSSLDDPQPFADRLDFLLVDRELVEVPLDGFQQTLRVALLSSGFAVEGLAGA